MRDFLSPRLNLLAGIMLLVLLAGISPSAQAQLADAPWPMYLHDLQHTGRSPYTGPEAPWEKWSFTTSSQIHSSPAVGADGTIYFGSHDNKVYAVNPDGSEKWSFTTGGQVYSSPAIGADGTIYAASDGNWGSLYAFNPDGSTKWGYQTGYYVRSSPAIGVDGTIYIGSTASKKLSAVNPDGSK